jgi:hypothetical protein
MTRIRATKASSNPLDMLARLRHPFPRPSLGEHRGRLAASAGLPAALAVKARLTAASGRAPIYPARVCDTFLTAERLDPGGSLQPACGGDRARRR